MSKVDGRLKWLYTIAIEKERDLGTMRHDISTSMHSVKTGSKSELDLKIELYKVEFAQEMLKDVIGKMERAILYCTDHPEDSDKLTNDIVGFLESLDSKNGGN